MAETLSIDAVFPRDAPLEGSWRITAVERDARRVLVHAAGANEGERVAFALWSSRHPSPAGPFDVGAQRVSYQVSSLPFERFRAAGIALGARLRAAAGAGDPADLVARWIAETPEAPTSANTPRRLPVLREQDPRNESAAPTDALSPMAAVRPVVSRTLPDGIVAIATAHDATAAVVAARAGSALRAGAREVIVRASAPLVAETLTLLDPAHRSRVRAEVTPQSIEALTSLPNESVCAVRLPLTHAVLGAIAQWLNAVAQAAPTATVTLVLPPFEGRVQAWNAETASFEALRAALPDATALAHSLGLRFGVEADAGVPRCAVPDDAPWITPSLPSEVTCTYGNVCERCALRNDCAGLSHDYAYLRGTRELAPVAREGAPLPSTEAAMGVSRVRGGGDDRGWADRLRERLTDRADAVVALGDVIPHEALAPWPCALPWTRLEVNNLTIGPCCSDYQSFPAQFRRGPSLAAYWNGPAMRAFRHAMVQGPPLAPCRTSCPYLMGATQAPPTVRLFGGPGDFVERQIELVDDMLAGREVMRGGPLKVSFTTTTYCNYDCLMCAYGEIGTLDDELPVSFYEDLARIAPGLRLIEALGGEPLASGVFREFLASFAFERFPALRLALITNGSYLTPKEQKRWQRVPFDNLTISLNAASPESYLAVNRGLSWERVRENLDALLQRRRDGELRCSIVYSMVILKRNLHEIRQFAELARRDGVGYRYLLPNHDRNGQSILTSREAMTEALGALEDVLAEEWARGNTRAVETLFGEVRVLEHRLAHNIVRTIPDGVTTRNG